MKFLNESSRRKYEDAKKAYDALMKFYPLTLDDLEGEIWRPVLDYEDYQASNFGRIKSFCKGKVKILKPQLTRYGYLRVCLKKNGKRRFVFIHRLVAELFLDNPLNKPEVNHKFGIKFDNYFENLEWSTGSENIKHAFDTGLLVNAKGVFNSQAKIKSQADILYIRNNPDNLTIKQLAEKFGVCVQTIGNIQRGLKYKNVGGVIRDKIDNSVPEEIKSQILARYQRGVVGCGCRSLAKEFGYSKPTILNIVNSPNSDAPQSQ